LKGRESNGVAGRTELRSGFCEKKKDGNVVVVVDDDDDACIILEKDAEELQSSSSGEEETFKDDSDDDDYRVELPESFMVEEEEKEEDGDREQGEMELKRNKVYGIEVLCDSDIGKFENNDVDMDDSLCVAKRTRSHYNLESAKKRMKLETVSRPLCVDEEKLDDNGDNDEDDTEAYEAVDVAQKVRSKKGKTKPTGGNGGDVDDGDETCDHKSQRRTIESREGSRDEHGHGVCRRKPSKRRRKEYEVVKILANSLFLDLEDVPFKEEREPLEEPVLPLKFTFGIEESSPPVKSEEEKQLEELWADMALALCLKDTTDDAAVCCHR
jgi:DNA repair and recombination RAD54-like protein